MQPAILADGSRRQVDPAWPRVDALSWWITVLIFIIAGAITVAVMLFASVGTSFVLIVAGGWLSLVGLLVLGAVRWPNAAYRRLHYIVTTRGVEIHRGLFWRRVINVPRSRIQHTDVVQGPLMRRYRLAALVIHTAGTQNSTITLEGLSHADALALRDYLIHSDTASAAHDAV